MSNARQKNNSGARCHSSGLVATITPVVLSSNPRDQVSSVSPRCKRPGLKSPAACSYYDPAAARSSIYPIPLPGSYSITTLDAHFKGCLFTFCLRGANTPVFIAPPPPFLVMPETAEKNDRASGLNLAEVCNLDS